MERTEITWHSHSVSREDRERMHGHQGCVVWFTGLSGCGKSTVANRVDQKLHAIGAHTFLLDGDNVRHSLNASPALLAPAHGEAFAKRFGLGFSAEDREENVVCFSSGWGDGVYPSFVGLTADGEVAALLTDFVVLSDDLAPASAGQAERAASTRPWWSFWG